VDVWAEALRHKQTTQQELAQFTEAARQRAEELGLTWKDTYLYHVLRTGELLPEQGEFPLFTKA